jgi:hypothetical protein
MAIGLAERKMVYRVYAALNAVPGANIGGGTQSTTVAGAVSFGADIGVVREHCVRALAALCDGSLDSRTRQEDFEEAMQKAEAYIVQRRKKDWSVR